MLYRSATHFADILAFVRPSFLHSSVELKLGQFVSGMTITKPNPRLEGWRAGGGEGVGMKGAKTIGRCQDALDVQ